SRLQNGIHLPSFRERTSLSLPYESTFCGLRFCERASILFPTALFQFYDWKAAKAGHPRRGCSKPFGALRSTFQPIYVGGSFTEAPCKWHNQSLRFPRSSVPTVLPACKTGSTCLAFAKEPHSLSPTGLHFVAFAFVGEPQSPSLRPYFSFMTER
ncbi:hypothetical protein AVEN_275701-1, partial [Araneus ventricosus]